MSQIENFTKKEIGIIKDPFKNQYVTGVRLIMYKGILSDEFEFDAYVEFINGKTSGEQQINGSSMDDIYNKTRDFIKTL